MKKYDIVLLTESRYVNPSVNTEYVNNILLEDEILRKELEKRGLQVTRQDWADPEFDWGLCEKAVFRTTWDYFHRFNEFKSWLEQVKNQTQLINTYEVIRWNMDKKYLMELEEKGVTIPPTRIVKKEENKSLQILQSELGWDEFVLKPTVSGAGRHTYRICKSSLGEYEGLFGELLEKEDMMVQEFQRSITHKGEVSLLFFGTNYSHSILKKAKKGDFRVQDDFGGTVHPYTASKEEVTFAKSALEASGKNTAYARVDIIWDNDNNLALSELELIEPELWLRNYPQGGKFFADAILREF